jgi:uncharacterized protein (DUF488 family)
MILTTIGYEGIIPAQLFETLLQNAVTVLVDVRELPISRKAGFSKAALTMEAERNGINYIHLPTLGSPKKIRHDYRADKDWLKFSKRYEIYLSFQPEEIEKLARLIRNENCCLLCFEADYRRCHRLYISETVKAALGIDLAVVHLDPSAKSQPAWPPSWVDISIQR